MGARAATKEIERASTGIKNLDAALSGGFPKGSLILVSGNPGTGKTILTAKFLYTGANDGENGAYVSFSEGKAEFYANMKTVGMDFLPLERRGKFIFLEMLSLTRSGMAKNMSELLETVRKSDIKRLVIDSYSVMSQSLENSYEARQTLHTVLSKLVRKMGCTTLIIGEQPSGETKLNSGESEFVSDGVINLRLATPRELEIRKMRGTKLITRTLVYTIDGGIDVLKTDTLPPAKPKHWRPIHDKDHVLSTGCPDFDAILGGGFPRGSYVLLETETEVQVEETRLLTRATALNFLAQGRGVQIIPTAGLAARDIKHAYEPYVSSEVFDEYMRITEESRVKEMRDQKGPTPPYAVTLSGPHVIDVAVKTIFASLEELKKKTGGRPVFRSIGYDTLESIYPGEADKMFAQAGLAIMRTRSGGDLTYAIVRPSLRILDRLKDIVEWHFKLSKKNGLLTLQGIKPITPMYGVSCNVSRGYPYMDLTILT
jgi:KaiC/GvpD/RAD55 family RecA-like ATPase